MIFWRIYNNQIISGEEVPMVGFDINKDSFIAPDEYIKNNKFLIFRTCLGIGDWVMLERMAFNLKENHPNCKVYLPSPKMIKEILGPMLGNWASWGDASQTVNLMFKNNPYIDGYFNVGEVKGDVTTDHYRVFNNDDDEPLAEQMLRFFGASEEQIKKIDSRPQLFFDKDEIKFGNSIIESYINKKEYGTLLLTNSIKEYYDDDVNSLLLKEINKFKNLTFFYYGSKSLEDTIFKDIKYIDLKKLNLPLRIQLYIKTMAQVNIGYQSGINDTISRYSQVICTPSTNNLGTNIVRGIKYLYKDKVLCI